MKIALLSALLMLATCGSGQRWERERAERAEAAGGKGTVVWLSPGNEIAAAVTLLTAGGVEVYAKPEWVYQVGDDCGPTFHPMFRVCTEWTEVLKNLPPAMKMETRGWRRPESRHEYALQVFPGAQGSSLRIPNRHSGIDTELRIFQRGSAWLIVITRTDIVTDLDKAVVAGGEQ